MYKFSYINILSKRRKNILYCFFIQYIYTINYFVLSYLNKRQFICIKIIAFFKLEILKINTFFDSEKKRTTINAIKRNIIIKNCKL